MKKILLLILTLFLFLACYVIYQKTEKNTLNYVLIGDELVNNPFILKYNNYRNDFVNNDYRLIDLLRIIKYNEELLINDKLVSIHQQLKEADVLVISIGINEINYKLSSDTKDKYTYINKFIDNIKKLFLLIDNYDYQQVYFMGYYHDNYLDDELFKYLNFNVKRITNNNSICFIDMDQMIVKDEGENKKTDNFKLNNASYRKIYKFIVENLEKC